MSTTPPPGWYPDPAGGGGARWWTGRDWGAPAAPSGPVPIVQPPLPAGTSTGTVWIYLQALLPLVSTATLIPYLLAFRTFFEQQLAFQERLLRSGAAPGDAQLPLAGFSGVIGSFALTGGLGLLVLAAWVVLALLDARTLRARGVVQPFPWAWAFLSVVYPIGRAVVVRRRTGAGLAPLWVFIVVYVAALVLSFVLFGLVFAGAMNGMQGVAGDLPST